MPQKTRVQAVTQGKLQIAKAMLTKNPRATNEEINKAILGVRAPGLNLQIYGEGLSADNLAGLRKTMHLTGGSRRKERAERVEATDTATQKMIADLRKAVLRNEATLNKLSVEVAQLRDAADHVPALKRVLEAPVETTPRNGAPSNGVQAF